MNLDQFLPVRLITGRGCVGRNADRLAALGGRCVIVTGGNSAKKSGALDDVTAALESRGVEFIHYDKVEPNPSLAGAKEAGELARAFGAEFVVGIGGGSPLDAAKAAAVYAANDMDVMDIYRQSWPNPALPLVLVGTTAGTGSEVSAASVMTTGNKKKKSFTNDEIYATISFGDPGYTDTLPLRFTISTALDALSHAIEGYFATSANDLSDLFAREAIKILLPELTLLAAVKSESQIPPETRDRLYYASILAGFTLARCGTCYCHTLGYFLTEGYGTPHGFACAAFLPDFIRRQARLLPEKAEILRREIGSSADNLCNLIESLNECPAVTVSKQEIDAVVHHLSTTKNYARTAPSGYTIEEATDVMTRLFGEKEQIR